MIKHLLIGLLAFPLWLSESQIRVSVSTDRNDYTPYDTIHIAITATNLTADTVTLIFWSSCESNYILDTFNLRNHTGCLWALGCRTIPPFSSYTWFRYNPCNSEAIYPLPPGEHTLIGEVIGYGMSDTLKVHVSPGTYVSQLPAPTGQIAIHACYPNPATGSVTIPFSLATGGRVRITLYDILGRPLMSILDDTKPQGEFAVPVDISHLPSGLYLARLKVGHETREARFMVTK